MTEKLETEFNRFKEDHKYNIISATMIIYGNKELSNVIPMLDDYNELNSKDNYDVAISIVDDIKEKRSEEEFDSIYETCWRRIRNQISDKKSYNLNNKNNDENE